MLQSHTTQLGDGGSVRLSRTCLLPASSRQWSSILPPAPLVGEILFKVSATLTESTRVRASYTLVQMSRVDPYPLIPYKELNRGNDAPR